MKKSLLFIFFCITFYTNAQLILDGVTQSFWTKTAIKDPYNEPYDSNTVYHRRHGFYQIVKNPLNCSEVLINPLIILDGYDPGDKRNIEGIKYIVNNRGKEDNITRLQEMGFDLIFLNFNEYSVGLYDYYWWWLFEDITRDGGSDFVMNNAEVLRELITRINTHNRKKMTPHQHDHPSKKLKIKIIGPSMGGLIARIALRKMELNSEDHNVGLFVSFDSPHLGASVPLGIQKFFTNESPSYGLAKHFVPMFEYLTNIFDTPAAKQMLIRHLGEDSKSYRTNFNEQLKEYSLPLESRNIALINGSLSGKPNKLEDDLNKKLIDFKLELAWNPFSWITSSKFNFFNLKMESFEDTGDHVFKRSENFMVGTKTTYQTYLTKTKFKEEESLDYVAGSYMDWKSELKDLMKHEIPFPFNKKEITFTQKDNDRHYDYWEGLMQGILRESIFADWPMDYWNYLL